MKSKKLFAILTLVAFMMTLVPAFAFGADPASYSASASKVTVDETTIDVYGGVEDMAVFTLTFKDYVDGVAQAVYGKDVTFYLKSDRDALVGWVGSEDDDKFSAGDQEIVGATASSSYGQAFTVTTNDAGKAYVYVGSGVTGKFAVEFYNGTPDKDLGKSTQTIGSKEITVQAGDGNKIALTIDSDKADEEEIGDEITLSATLTDKGGNELEEQTVLFKKSLDGGSYTTMGEAKTDEDGVAEFDVSETKAGAYKYQAVLKSDKDVKSAEVSFAWKTDGVDKIVAKTADNTKIAQDEEYDLEFYVYDSQGNVIKSGTKLVTVEVLDQPKNSTVDTKIENDYGTDGDGIATVSMTPKKTGTYKIKVKSSDKSSINTTLTVVCQEFGDAVDMKVELKDDQPNVKYSNGSNIDGELKVTLVDKDGVEKDYTKDDDLRYGSSNRDVLEINKDGQLTVTDEDFTGEVTISVVDTDSGVSKDFELNVVGKPVDMKPIVTVNGKKAAVELQYIDKNGNRTFSDDDDSLRLILPSDVTSEGVEDFDAKEGNTKFDLVAKKAGEYTIIANSDIGLTKSFKVAFEVPASEKVVVGAKNVTMFIGNSAYVQDGAAKVTDVAPFIKDNRTFVAIRPVADAFGCEIGWDEATQTVTLTRSDLTVTIVIGSSDIAVVKDGVTNTVTADVPAFIQNGRTVLPFRAIGNAFGATVNYDAATQSVSYAQ